MSGNNEKTSGIVSASKQAVGSHGTAIHWKVIQLVLKRSLS
jgi:hypothetical protein